MVIAGVDLAKKHEGNIFQFRNKEKKVRVTHPWRGQFAFHLRFFFSSITVVELRTLYCKFQNYLSLSIHRSSEEEEDRIMK